MSVLASLLVHTVVLSAATWTTVHVWGPAGEPPAAWVQPAVSSPEPASNEPEGAPLDLPALPAPRHAVSLPDDPPPPDDSIEHAPDDTPWGEALAPVPAPPRVWDLIAGGQALAPLPTRRPRAAPAPTAEAALVPPVPLHLPPPERPAVARHGTVLLRVLVAADGAVAEVRVQESSGVPLLDVAAARAARAWRFRPATRAGAAEAAWVEIPVRF